MFEMDGRSIGGVNVRMRMIVRMAMIVRMSRQGQYLAGLKVGHGRIGFC